MKTTFGTINQAGHALHSYSVDEPTRVKLKVLAPLLRSMSAQIDAITLALKGLQQGTEAFNKRFAEVMATETDYTPPEVIKAPIRKHLTTAQLMCLQDLDILEENLEG